MPPPDLSALGEPGRGLLTQALDYFERQRGTLAGRDLGLAYGRLGLHLLAQGQASSAVAALTNARDLDANNYRWPYYLALTQSLAGNPDAAVALYGDALRLRPGDPVVATRLGLALIDAGKTASARSLLEPVTEDAQQRSAAAVAGLGRIAFESGDYTGAIDWYQQALEIDPNATRLNLALANAHDALGQGDAAARARQQAGDQLPVFNDPLVALLDAHRQPSSHFVALGDQARDAGGVAQAAVFYDFAVAINPEDAQAAERLAQLRRTVGQSRASPDAATKKPETPEDYFERGVYLAAQGEDARAIADYRASLAARPDDVATRVFLANAQMRQKAYSEAAVNYGTASARDTQNAELKFRQGIAWLAAGRCDRAETAFLAGYELDQTALRIVQALARLYATCEVAEDKRRTAMRYAQLIYNAQPTLETAETLAMVLAANGQFEDAADFQRQAIFEALKTGRAQSDSTLSDNLERYVAGKTCERAWPADHPIFSPAPPKPGAPAG